METTKIPYDYQQECIQAVLGHFAAGNRRAMYVMATGLGKTFVLAHILRELFVIGTVRRACVALDKGTPLPQIRDELLEVLGELGITINVITSRSKPEEWNCDIVVTTLQLLHSRRAKLPRDMFDLLAVDEAHHAQARTYRAAIEHFDCDWLAFTGTPRRNDGLDITEMFGEPVYNLPLEEAIRRKLGADIEYIVYSDNIDILELRKFAKKLKEGDRTITRRQLNDTLFLPTLYEQVVRIVRERSERRMKTLIFCNSGAHVDETLKHFDGAKPFHVKVPKWERDKTFAAFRDGDLSEVVAIDMLNEAVDFPDVQHLVMLRSTDSESLWKQQIGRGYRGRGKKVVIHDFVANVERIVAVRELGLAITRRVTSEGFEKPDALVVDGFAVEFSSEIVEIIELLDRLRGDFYTLAEASAAAHRLGIQTVTEYKKKYKKDPRLPSNPNAVYASEWVSWPHFLGTDFYPTLAEASAAAHRLGVFRTRAEYAAAYKSDKRLPAQPYSIYASEWVSWPHFLGTDFYPTLAEASAAAHRLGVRTGEEYAQRYKEDPRLRSEPEKLYASEWVSWPHFLGTDFYPTLAEASAAARGLGIQTGSEYKKKYKKDPHLPSNPNAFYASEWVSWSHFLHGNAKSFYSTLAEASAAAQRLGIQTVTEYKKKYKYKKDPRLPGNPNAFYASEWVSWSHFLRGAIGKREVYTTLAEASAATQRLGIRTGTEYKARYKEDAKLPSNPYRVYASERVSWPHFFGTK